jgi:hypothetical protein
MADALVLAAAQLVCMCGMAWLALAMRVHWRQVRGAELAPAHAARTLRVIGPLALLASLLMFVSVDHASMAVLVWVMSMTASVLVLAFTLAWRPRLLAWLVAWVPAPRSPG